ncbi:hypothetical protein JAAARDRAFT_450016 [Jaapia argillacea MUCL 33604]|uniref:Uncharacterized protein n=1 Tax=Jaapia argillacea MUCL 33604 TaxID=933084 RepID=A0A067Q577_9AGAM|nr:hypothetical protein JAAARDRAFT_450016 [Jaapia argillacea MUCL 33604]
MLSTFRRIDAEGRWNSAICSAFLGLSTAFYRPPPTQGFRSSLVVAMGYYWQPMPTHDSPRVSSQSAASGAETGL